MIKDNNGVPCLYDDDTGELLATAYFKTPYNHDRDAESLRVALTTPEPSLTDQSFKDETDINTIMERVLQTRELPLALPEHFGDATQIPTLFDARMRITESNKTFYNLPAKIREEFMNDPGRWESQVAKDLDNGDIENLKRMGLDISDLKVVIRTPTKPPAAPQAGTPAPGAPEPAAAPAAPVTAPPGPN